MDYHLEIEKISNYIHLDIKKMLREEEKLRGFDILSITTFNEVNLFICLFVFENRNITNHNSQTQPVFVT